MPPRRSQVAQSQPTLPTPLTDNAQTRRTRTRVTVTNHAEGESFDLNDISSGDDEDDGDGDNLDPTYNPANEPNNTINHPHNHNVAHMSQAADAGINNPDLLEPKVSSAADIHYFFEVDGEHMVCVECR